jgi:hypothetical protein
VDEQTVDEVLTGHTARVRDSDNVFSLFRGHEVEVGILAEVRPSVVIAVIDHGLRVSVRGETRSRRMGFDLEYRAEVAVVLRRRAEVGEPLAPVTLKENVLVRTLRQTV